MLCALTFWSLLCALPSARFGHHPFWSLEPGENESGHKGVHVVRSCKTKPFQVHNGRKVYLGISQGTKVVLVHTLTRTHTHTHTHTHTRCHTHTHMESVSFSYTTHIAPELFSCVRVRLCRSRSHDENAHVVSATSLSSC